MSADAKHLATRLRKRSVTIAGHRTSVSLEQAFWDALKEIADADGLSVNALVAGIDADRTGNLSSGLRVFVLQRLRGHGLCGQGPGDPTGPTGPTGSAGDAPDGGSGGASNPGVSSSGG